MQSAFDQAALLIGSFLFVWLGAGLVVNPISALAKTWKLPAFTVSFFLLGLLTSLPEIMIGSISVLEDDPSIYAGVFLGGSIVLLLGVVPLLGLVGAGIRMPRELGKARLMFTLATILTPAILLLDQRITREEGILMIALYIGLFLSFSFQESLVEKLEEAMVRRTKKSLSMIFKIVVGVAILLFASNQIVNSTLFFSDLWKISPFFVSLIVIAIGANVPELSIIFRSVLNGKKDIALADYLGSAAANTFLLGVFTVLRGSTLELPNHVLQRFFFLLVGLVLFFFFARSRNTISRKESALLLLLYLSFLVFELILMM